VIATYSELVSSPELRSSSIKNVVLQDDFLKKCGKAAPGTFGASYYAFMSRRGFSADDRPPVRFVDNSELAYVATRYRQVHDFWHTVFGCNTSLLGETTLKALEFTQVWRAPKTRV
jgi:ubiquinone biosynthesis protein COQ4